MEKPSRRFQVLVIVFMVIGLAVHGVAFLLFSVDIHPRMRPSKDRAYVDFFAPTESVRGSALEEALVLFDTEPLFLPHRMNYAGELDLSTRRWEPESALLDPFAPSIVMSEAGLEELQIKRVEFVDPSYLLSDFGGDYWSSFGVGARTITQPRAVGGIFMEVKRLGQGNFLAFELPVDSMPPSTSIPMETARFLVYLGDRSGFSEPFLVKGCGSEAYDVFFRDLVVSVMPGKLLGQQGYFEVNVGL